MRILCILKWASKMNGLQAQKSTLSMQVGRKNEKKRNAKSDPDGENMARNWTFMTPLLARQLPDVFREMNPKQLNYPTCRSSSFGIIYSHLGVECVLLFFFFDVLCWKIEITKFGLSAACGFGNNG